MPRNQSECYPKLLEQHGVCHGNHGSGHSLRLEQVTPSTWRIVVSGAESTDARCKSFSDYDSALGAYETFPNNFWYSEHTNPLKGWGMVHDAT